MSSSTSGVGGVRRILIVKLGAIGDVVMALPLSRYLVARGDQVTWLCGASVAPLVRAYSQADHVEVLDEAALLRGSLWQRLKVFFHTQTRFLGCRYDEILVGHTDPRYSWLVAGARGRRRRFGQKIAGTNTPNGHRHHAYEYLKLATREDSSIAVDPRVYIPAPLRTWQGRGSGRVALAPGGARNLLADDHLRRWPLSHYRSLAESLLRRGFEVELHGAASDQWILPEFQGLAVRSRLGETDLLGFIENLSQVEVLVTHDSGPLHLAGLAGVPVVGLFGPTRGAWRFPLSGLGKVIEHSTPLPCQPCYDGRSFANCRENRCLTSLTPGEVMRQLDGLLDTAARGGF